MRSVKYTVKRSKTYEEFISLLKVVYREGYRIQSKRRRKEAYSFTHLYKTTEIMIWGRSREEAMDYFSDEKYLNRVSYLFDDGISTGESYVKNLYKNLEIL